MTRHQRKQTLWPFMVGQHPTKYGVISQTNKPTNEQKTVLNALNLKAPKRYIEVPRPTRA